MRLLIACLTLPILLGCSSAWEGHAKAAILARSTVVTAQQTTQTAHHDALSEVIAANAAAGEAAAEAAAKDESKRWEPLYDGVNLVADATNAYVAAVAAAIEYEDNGLEASWDEALRLADALVAAWQSAASLAEGLGVDGFPKAPGALVKLLKGAN